MNENNTDRASDRANNDGERAESNPLGLAGFIVSLVGLCSGGALSPIGLILSAVAVFRRPRGFAIAGLVLGALGVAWVVLLAAIVGVAMLAAVLLGMVEGRGALETAVDGWKIRDAIVEYHEDHGDWPADIGQVSGVEPGRLEDRWGRPYHIEIDDERHELRLVSDGPDGEAGTDDDINVEFDF